MTFALRYHPAVRVEDLPLIDGRMKVRIRQAIEQRLRTAPQDYGEPLRKSLKGYWKLRVGDYSDDPVAIALGSLPGEPSLAEELLEERKKDAAA